MTTRDNDSAPLQEFAAALGARDPKTVAAYLTTVRDFVVWLATQPGGTLFHLGLVTETAVRGYMDYLVIGNRAPRTRSKALSALRRFCQWAVDEGHLRRNPAIEFRPSLLDKTLSVQKAGLDMLTPLSSVENVSGVVCSRCAYTCELQPSTVARSPTAFATILAF